MKQINFMKNTELKGERKTVWSDVQIKAHDMLSGTVTADVAVIGAGLCGMLTAYRLAARGADVAVIEADRIGGGQTMGTTAKITVQHGAILGKLADSFGERAAAIYAYRNGLAIEEYKALCEHLAAEYGDDALCDFEYAPAYLYTITNEHILEREYDIAKRFGIKAVLASDTELPIRISTALKFEDQAKFNPRKLLKYLSERERSAGKLRIYEQTRAVDIDRMSSGKNMVKAINGDGMRVGVIASNVVFACHFPFMNFPGLYFARMHQSRSYVIGIQGEAVGADGFKGMYKGIDRGSLSFRSVKDGTGNNIMLIGGEGHRTGSMPGKDRHGEPVGRYDLLLRRTKALFGEKYDCKCRGDSEKFGGFSVIYRWSAQDIMTVDGLPYIGRFSDGGKTADGWYVATGFGKWGMTNSMVAADILCDLICRDSERAEEQNNAGNEREGLPAWKSLRAAEKIYAPDRVPGKGAAGRLFGEMGHSVSGLAKQQLAFPIGISKTPEELKPGEGGVVRLKGYTVGAYRDEAGKLHIVTVKCPHLGCRLVFNPEEKSWDCPCHGSRFDIDGKRLSGPATSDIGVSFHE